MAEARKAPDSGNLSGEFIALWIGLGVIVAINVVVWAGFNLAAWINGTPGTSTILPVLDVLRDPELSWSPLAVVLTVVFAALVVGAASAALVVWSGRKRSTLAVDQAAKSMSSAKDLKASMAPAVAESNRRLSPGVDYEEMGEPGLLIGNEVRSRKSLYMTDEETGLMIAGTRAGKTQSLVVRAIVSSPGACLATSSKADVVDFTLHSRELRGKVWIFDVQDVYSNVPVQWWWDPFKCIERPADAKRLASYFAAGAKPEDARPDAYFDPESERVFASYIFAARLAGGDMLHVLDWLLNPALSRPAEILELYGYSVAATSARQISNLTERQRDGIFGMARRYLDLLENPEVAKAILPPRRVKIGLDSEGVFHEDGERLHDLPEFDIEEYVGSDTDTLYLLSRKGSDSASGLTTALAGEVFQAAIRRAQRSPGRRLPVPLRPVLDEVANVVKLRELPDWYSDFGSQGITPISFLQSRAQGERVWGQQGMAALAGTANVQIYGGGAKDDGYLENLSKLVGDHWLKALSRTSGSGGSRSRSVSWNKDRILSVKDLSAMPKNRQLVMIAGMDPVMCEKVFWSDTAYADEIRTSVANAEALEGGDELDRGYIEQEIGR